MAERRNSCGRANLTASCTQESGPAKERRKQREDKKRHDAEVLDGCDLKLSVPAEDRIRVPPDHAWSILRLTGTTGNAIWGVQDLVVAPTPTVQLDHSTSTPMTMVVKADGDKVRAEQSSSWERENRGQCIHSYKAENETCLVVLLVLWYSGTILSILLYYYSIPLHLILCALSNSVPPVLFPTAFCISCCMAASKKSSATIASNPTEHKLLLRPEISTAWSPPHRGARLDLHSPASSVLGLCASTTMIALLQVESFKFNVESSPSPTTAGNQDNRKHGNAQERLGSIIEIASLAPVSNIYDAPKNQVTQSHGLRQRRARRKTSTRSISRKSSSASPKNLAFAVVLNQPRPANKILWFPSTIPVRSSTVRSLRWNIMKALNSTKKLAKKSLAEYVFKHGNGGLPISAAKANTVMPSLVLAPAVSGPQNHKKPLKRMDYGSNLLVELSRRQTIQHPIFAYLDESWTINVSLY
ncbi:hypothetical protein B7463_g9166, partial [Scytalidium lignicola]